jgi:hypothetical protein
MTLAAPRTIKRRQKQTSRDILAHLFMAAWICVLMQGALRKWFFPGAAILYLIQDVPLMMAYVWALWKGLVWTGKLGWTCVVIAIVLGIQAMLQIIFVDLKLRTALVGWHHYVFYLPILFVAPVCYNFKHRRNFLRWNMLSIIPMAMIATIQSRSPKAAWINRTSAGDDTGFGLATDTVRATGTFNFTLTYSIWCGFAVGIVLGEWLLPPERRAFKSKIILLVCTLSAMLATMVSGSRTAIGLAGLAFLGGFATVVVTRNVKLIMRFSAVLVLLPVLAVISSIAAPASFNALLNRFSGEGYQGEIETRLEHMFLGFTYASGFSVLGAGIGYGIPAANPGMGAAIGIVLSEHETIRIVQELGSFTGTALVAMRYVAGIWLIFASFKCVWLPRGHSFPHAVPLAFAVAPILMVGELVRSAPLVATETYFAIALGLGAVLFRHEPLNPGPARLPQKR